MPARPRTAQTLGTEVWRSRLLRVGYLDSYTCIVSNSLLAFLVWFFVAYSPISHIYFLFQVDKRV